jgi:integrase
MYFEINNLARLRQDRPGACPSPVLLGEQMATFRKRGDKWQARVQRYGQSSLAKSFNNKADALKWARNVESQLDLGMLAPKQTMPRLMPMVDRYVEEVTPTKKGESQERYRANQFRKTTLADMQLDKVTSEVVAQYRDNRLKQVSANTVRLELALLSVVFEQCRKEWGFAVNNPVRQIRMPKPGNPRQRRLEDGEEAALLAACKASRAFYLHSFVMLAIETGMRSGEMLAVTWSNVNFEKRTIFLPDTKNGSPRTVPLSTQAFNAIQALPRSINGRLFTSGYHSIHKAFQLAVTKAQATKPENVSFLRGLRFHDLRHEAVTRLFEKGLNPIEVGMVSGHKTLSMLQRYTHLRSEELVAKLA